MIRIEAVPKIAPQDQSNDGSTPTGAYGPLTRDERDGLLYIARHTLLWLFDRHEIPHWQTDAPTLQQLRAAFVTLRLRGSGELRGCRGECMARRPLCETVAAMTVAAALDDPRFPPVQPHEVPHLLIEINALTPLLPVTVEDIEVGRHGLMIVKGRSMGLLLPEVARNFGWDRDQFLGALCHKAGLAADAWRESDARLFGFESEAWSEESTLADLRQPDAKRG